MKTVFQKDIYGKGFKSLVASVALAVGICGSAAAQETERELDRRVDVSREYLPDMDRAAKLTIAPVMNDTVALRPDLDYTVNPSPWVTGFGVAAINPVRVDAASYDALMPFYLKAGFGFPSRSVVDFYGTTTSTGGGYAGGYLNHNGNWSKLKNEYGSKERALQSNNKVGIFGRTYIGSRIALAAEVGYDYDIYSKYNFIRYPDVRDKSTLTSYSTPHISLGIGNDFTDLSFFNFAVGAEGYMLNARNNVKESGFKANLAIGKMFGIHRFELAGMYEGSYGAGARKGHDVNILSAKPSYRLDQGMLKIGAGVEIAYVNTNLPDKSKTYFLPSAQFSINLAEGAFVPYADLESQLISNSFRSITLRNPYFHGGFYEQTPSRDYKLLGGVRGEVGVNFAYEVRVGGGFVKDILYFANYAGFDDFSIFRSSKLNYFTAGGSLSGRISERFTAGLDVDYYNYSAKSKSNQEPEHALGMPEFTGNLHISYNYRGKLFLKLHGSLTGTRYFADYKVIPSQYSMYRYFDDYEKISARFDLGLDAEYRLTKNLGVFLSGENLLNQKLYPWYMYRGFGIGITAGVKLLF